MDSLLHHWNETKKIVVKVIFYFWWQLIKWSQCDKGVKRVTLKSSHMSAVKALWWCDLWEDLFAAALGDDRE